jgi:serpin B
MKTPRVAPHRLIPWLFVLLGAACDAGVAPPQTSSAGASASQTSSSVASSAAATSATSAPPPPVSSVTPSTHVRPAPDPAAVEAASRFAKSSNAFALDLYPKLAGSSTNFAYAPASLSIALAMTWGGAKGETAAEMRKVLHLEGDDAKVTGDAGSLVGLLRESGPAKLAVANRLFGMKAYTFDAGYLDRTQKAFDASLEPLDFASALEPSRLRINDWVATNTEQRIKDLLPEGSLDGQTRLVLVNAIYMKASWENAFNDMLTQPADFSVSKTEKKQVPTMRSEGTFAYAETATGAALELDYEGRDLSMVVLLPKEVDGLAALEKELTTVAALDGWLKALSPKQVSVALPRFSIDPPGATSLNAALKALGMSLPFDVAKADFTGMANPSNKEEQLYLAKVFHKTFVKVDEKGTEAAGASAVSMAAKGAKPPSPKLELKADHPFLYLIRDKRSGAVLFMGRVGDPSKK